MGTVRIQVEPVYTLGDLIKLVDKARAAVDTTMTNQTQSETPVKVEVTFGGRIRAIKLDELDPRGLGIQKCQASDPSRGGAEWCYTHGKLLSSCPSEEEPLR